MQPLPLSLKLSGVQFSQFQARGICCGLFLALLLRRHLSFLCWGPVCVLPLCQGPWQHVCGKDAQRSTHTFLQDVRADPDTALPMAPNPGQLWGLSSHDRPVQMAGQQQSGACDRCPSCMCYARWMVCPKLPRIPSGFPLLTAPCRPRSAVTGLCD